MDRIITDYRHIEGELTQALSYVSVLGENIIVETLPTSTFWEYMHTMNDRKLLTDEICLKLDNDELNPWYRKWMEHYGNIDEGTGI
jgi:hypothetical protein